MRELVNPIPLRSRRGTAMVYAVLSLGVLMGITSLAVDFGRTMSTRAELQDLTDAAARHAARGLKSTLLSTSGAAGNASAVFAETRVDGATVNFNANTDLQLGIWSHNNKTFTPATLAAGANSVKIMSRLTMGDTTHPLYFLSFFNQQTTIRAESIALITGDDATTYVSAKGNPWLAGMPSGTVCTDFRTSPSEQDTAGTGPNDKSSPAVIYLSSLNISAGTTITVDGVTGQSSFGGGYTDADGNPLLTCNLGSPAFGNYTYYTSAMNGMSNLHAPVNSVVAVFLSDDAPNSGSAPSPLDFASAASRDYISIAPALKQVFFVGDGRRSNGEVQQIVVPAGATRLFICSMDGWQYNNNTGGYNLTVHAVKKVTTVYAH